MPRLLPSLYRQAKRHSPHAATLLPICRDIPSALQELRWIREHVEENWEQHHHEKHVLNLCRRRGRGEPLQYVLGSQPFGNLDIGCRPGVLIPRWETEAYTVHLARLLRDRARVLKRNGVAEPELRMVDLCTGTGCIPLLAFASLHKAYPKLHIRGVELSTTALDQARLNIKTNIEAGRLPKSTEDKSLEISQGNVFDKEIIHDCLARLGKIDVLVSNPPYISEDIWLNSRGQMGRSVAKHEPKVALVPDHSLKKQVPSNIEHADVFYARLLDIAAELKPSILLFEIGDGPQALRVVDMCHEHPYLKNASIELWRDNPDLQPEEGEERRLGVPGKEYSVPVLGTGHVRSVFIRRRNHDHI